MVLTEPYELLGVESTVFEVTDGSLTIILGTVDGALGRGEVASMPNSWGQVYVEQANLLLGELRVGA